MMNKDEFEAAQALAPGMEGLHRYMQGLIDKMPRVPDRMAVYILEETAKLFDQKDFSEILMLIAKSRNGLTEKELEELLELEEIGFSPVKFQQIMSYLYDAFSQRSNGKWTFNHRLYTQAVCELMSDDDTKRIERLFTEYALKNEDFLICEGFYHLLAQKHPTFAQVLEKSNRWDTKSEVRSLVGTSAKDNIEVREFFTELCLVHPSDELADFWLDFDERGYGEDVCEMLKEIITNLLLTSVSDSRKWQLAVRSTYYIPKENHLAILSDARSYAQSLEKTERYIADASIESEVFYSLSILRAPYDEITQALKNSTDSIEQAFASLNKKGSYKQYDSLFKSLYTVNDVATYRRISDADKMWLRALELLESVEHLESENEDDYVYYKVVFLSQLCDIYCSKPWLDYDESKRFGDKALELCELAVSKRPTMRNLRNKFDTLTSYVRRLKAEYSCPYRSQIVDCARQIYAMEKSNHNKRQLAVALGEYGLAYIKAVNSGVLKYDSDKIREAVKLLDKSAELFEELLSLDYTRGQLMVYATITVDRVELLCDNPDKALKYAHRSLDLLLQRMSQINEEAKSAQESELDFYQRQLMWCEGWIGRAKSAMATIYMEQLDLENSLLYAKEGLELNRKNTRNALVYCRQMLNCALVLAQSLYYLRADDEALLACDEATAILDELGSQGESREPFEAELMYIRGRIAFEHADIVTAWEKCRECLNRKKTKVLYNKALILKADCLQAMGDSESDAAWKEALKVWREELSKENKEFSRVAQYIKSMGEPKPDIKVKWRTYNSYKLPAFYMAYCYHHYVNTEKRMTEDYDSFERKVLFALYFYGKGYLKDRIPYGLKKKELPEHSTAKLSVCSDIGEFAQIMSEIISLERFVAKDVSELIFENIDRFSDVELDEQQSETLMNVAKNTYYKLTEERRSLYHHKQGHDLLQEIFGLDDTYPVHKIEVDFKGDVYSEWPSDCVESTSKCWYALFKLLIFLFAHNPDKSRKLGGIFRSVYMVVSEQSGGSDVVSEADLSFLTQNEIRRLIEFYDGETELSMSKANKKWFSFKNRWYTELYIATKDKKLIDTRLKELKSYLEEPYSSMYYETNEKAIDSDIVNAIIDLIKVLNSRGAGEQAIDVVRFAESSDVLSNRLNSKTLFSVQALSEKDREWLDEVKYKHCQMWLDNNKGGLFSIHVS